MRYFVLTCIALVASQMAMAQTMNVRQGNLVHAYEASMVGDITQRDGSILLGGMTYDVSKITDIVVNNDAIDANSVNVSYADGAAKVVVAGNIAPHIKADIRGAHVSLVADEALTEEVTYTLSGKTSDGSFYMDADVKSTVVLNGVDILNPDSAAINIACGKRIDIIVADATNNTLTDGIRMADDGTDAHKACLYVNGHPDFTGSGKLSVYGKVKHGIATDEYCRIKAAGLQIDVVEAVSDGLHINQYLQVQSGTLVVNASGDGIDVGAKKDNTLEHNGETLLEGGMVVVKSTGAACKALKSAGKVTVSGGIHAFAALGDAVVDGDISSAAAIKTDGDYLQSGGSVTASALGSGGKGINAGGDVTITAGELTAYTIGDVFKNGSDDTKPHAVKSDKNIVVGGGSVRSAASQKKGQALKAEFSVLLNGGTVMGIGGKQSTIDAASQLTVKTSDGYSVKGGTDFTYSGLTFKVPAEYTNSNAYVLTAK